MPVCLENLNMDFFRESEENYVKLMEVAAAEGKPLFGYYQLPYFNKHFGSVQIILRTSSRPQNDTPDERCIQGEGLDTHTAGRCVWEVRLHEMNIDRKDADILMKRVVVTRMDGGGMAVVNLVNADVLPSFMKNDVIKMQVVAFPELIEYFKDEDDYASHQSEANDGNKWLIGEGTVFPSGMMRNRNPKSSEFESDENLDDLSAIRGIVKSIYWGDFEFNGESHDTYIKCIIDTEFGELEIAHTVEQVDEQFRCNMEVGATVIMYGTLSGDVAIFDYDNGIVRDEENNLAAMRYMYSGNDPERIRSILSKDAVYLSQSGGKYVGEDEIIERLKYVQKNNPDKYYAHNAVIVSIDDGDEPLDYSVGKRCLILASGEEENYESIAFFDYDENWNICRIVTSTNPRYHFAIQNPAFEKLPEEDEE